MTPDKQLQSSLHHTAWNQRKWPLNTPKTCHQVHRAHRCLMCSWLGMFHTRHSLRLRTTGAPTCHRWWQYAEKKKEHCFQFSNGDFTVRWPFRKASGSGLFGTHLLRSARQTRQLRSMWDDTCQLQLLVILVQACPPDRLRWRYIRTRLMMNGGHCYPRPGHPAEHLGKVTTRFLHLLDGRHICTTHCQPVNCHGFCVLSPHESDDSAHFFLVQSFSSGAIFQLNM
jgi:hypothetical protein